LKTAFLRKFSLKNSRNSSFYAFKTFFFGSNCPIFYFFEKIISGKELQTANIGCTPTLDKEPKKGATAILQ